MKEVIRIHKPNSSYFVEKRLVMNVRGEMVYQRFQIPYTQIKRDKVTLFVAYNSELKKYNYYHVNAIVNLFNRTFISNFSIQLWLLDSGTFFFKVFGGNAPSLSGYLSKKKGRISFNSSLDGISFYRHYMYDMFREMTDIANYNIFRGYNGSNWFTYESE